MSSVEAREEVIELVQEALTCDSEYLREKYRPGIEQSRDIILKALDRLDALEEQDKANTELIGEFNVLEIKHQQDLTKANAKVELLLDKFVYSEGLCSALRITEKEHRCPTPDDCDGCWHEWLDKETK